MMPLALLSPGESGEILSINVHVEEQGGCCGQCGGERHGRGGRHGQRDKNDNRVEELGLRAGKIVEMLANGSGPLLLKVDESRIAISRGMAMKIKVRRVQ